MLYHDKKGKGKLQGTFESPSTQLFMSYQMIYVAPHFNHKVVIFRTLKLRYIKIKLQLQLNFDTVRLIPQCLGLQYTCQYKM